MPPARFLLLGGEPQPESGYFVPRLPQGIYARSQSSQGCRVELRDVRFVHFQTISDLFHREFLPIIQDNNLLFTPAPAGKSATQPSAQGKNRRRAVQCLETGNIWSCHKNLNRVALSGPAPLNVGTSSWGRRQYLTHGMNLAACAWLVAFALRNLSAVVRSLSIPYHVTY